jgi:hypothetical protein
MNVFSDFVDITPNTEPRKISTGDGSSLESSLTEPITETIKRDLNTIYVKLAFFFISKESNADSIKTEIRNYDLWGPFVFSLLFAFSVTFHQQESMEKVFSTVILYILFGTLILTLNSRLLKTSLSFFQGKLSRNQRGGIFDVPDEFGRCLQYSLFLYALLPETVDHRPRHVLVGKVRIQGRRLHRARR